MRFRAADVPAGTQVVLTVHDPLQSRTAFDQSVSGGSLPPSRDLTPFPFDTLPTDASGNRILVYPTAGIGQSGVYPLEVDLRGPSEDSLAHFVTHVVVAPVGADGTLTVGVPLQVAWVWPLRADPSSLGGLVPNNPATLADLEPDGRLGRQATQLAADTDVPLTLAPSPETLEAWSAIGLKSPTLAAGADAIRAAGLSGHHQVLTGPYVPLDLPSIQRAGLGGVVNPGLTRGITALESFFGAHLDPSTALPGPLDQAALRTLQIASARQLVLEGSQLTPANEKFTPAHPYKVQAVPGDDASAVTAVATDPGLQQFLRGDEPPALRAAHLLAGLALIAGEQPSVTRGVAITNPDRWDADDTFVAETLAGLRDNPLVQPNTVAGLLAAVPVATVDGEPDGAPVVRQLASYDPPAPPVTLAQYQKGEVARDAVAELVGARDRNAALGADRDLARSVSADWANPPGRVRARQLLASISSSVDGFLNQIEVQSQGTVTITSSKAEIPISFRNTSDQVVAVHLKLESDRLLFPEGAERDITLPASRNTTVRVAVETRGSGTAPVRMTVTADGLPVRTATIKVRSTFVSGVGVFLTVGAIVFLAIWWGWDIHRRRKRRSQAKHPSFPIGTPSGQPA